jgi:hypothetical protein
LLTALELGLFDDLEVPRLPEDLAQRHGLAPHAAASLCADLVGARLLVARDHKVRNTEVASRFLRATGPAYLGPLLRSRLQDVLTADWLTELRADSGAERKGRPPAWELGPSRVANDTN